METVERTLFLNGTIAEDSWFDDDVTPQMFKEELMDGNGNITVWIVKRHFTANSNITLFLRDLPVLRQFIAKKSFFYYGKITLFLKKRREDLFRSSQHNSISFIADNTISVSMCVLLFCAPIIRDFVRIKFNFRILPPQLP